MKNVYLLILFIATINQSFGQSEMEISNKQFVRTKTINQSIDTAWWHWTTHEGLKTFFGKDNKIELIPNGTFEIYFLPDKPIGFKGSEGCKVLSYLPNKYFSFSWIAPPQFKEARSSGYKTWVVVEFDSISDKHTQITLTHLGWPNDDMWIPVYDYFSKAWEVVFNNLSGNEQYDVKTDNSGKKVTGIGGVFFKCKDPEKVKDWYKTHLGLNTDQYGTNFEWRQGADASKYGFTQWSPFAEKTKYFEPSTRDFMINYRVENIETLTKQLKKEGVTVVDEIETYEYGKFVHILDVEGNKLELWEPNDEEYDKIVGGRTK